jgi:hypothetical protein
MRKYYLIGCMFTMLHLTAMAQTEQQLENAIRVYQTILESSPKPDADPVSLLKLADNAEQLFKSVLKKGTAEEQRTTKYFLAVLTQLRAEVYLNKPGSQDKAVGDQILKSIESEFDRLGPAEFPFKYQSGGAAFVIQYTGFLPVRQRFYGELAEYYFRKSDVVNLKKYAQKVFDLQPEGYYVVTFFMHKYLYDFAVEKPGKMEEARKMMDLYAKMDAAQRADMNRVNFGTVLLKPMADLFLAGKSAPLGWDKNGSASFSIAETLRIPGDMNALAGQFYSQALDLGYGFNIGQCWDLLPLFEQAGMSAGGWKFCNKILPQISAENCADYERLASYFKKFGDANKAKAIEQTASRCRDEAQKRAQEAQKRQERAARRANRNRVYVGAYVLRMVQRPQYIDLGGVINLPIGQSMLEFSYMKAKNDQDYLLNERLGEGENLTDFPNPHWDGFYAHFGYKKLKSERSASRGYMGFLLTYNERNYQPQTSAVLDKTSGVAITQDLPFTPKLTSYGAMLNFGQLWQHRPFGTDFYFGVGATYNLFNLNNPSYARADYNFSNAFLSARKETFWGFQIRMGMTLGFSL